MAKLTGVDLWYETFGDCKNEAILLIMGGCCQGNLWPLEFCIKLANIGFYVIRYDHRDTGLSSYFDFDKNPYDLKDMMKDAIHLLDYLKIDKAHGVGLSMGGPIAELLAANYQNRINTITLMSTSCDLRPTNLAYAGLPAEEGALPRPTDLYLRWMNQFQENHSVGVKDIIQFRLEGWRILSGSKVAFNETLHYELHKQYCERSNNLQNTLNHIMVCKNSETMIKNAPSKVNVPALIIHGSEDPILPPEHGFALARQIKNSSYIFLDGMGHVLNEAFYDVIISSINHHIILNGQLVLKKPLFLQS